MSEYLDTMITNIEEGFIEKPEAMMSILADMVLASLDRGTREGLLDLADRLVQPIRTLYNRARPEMHEIGRTYNDTADVNNAVNAAYYAGQMSMAHLIVADRGQRTMPSDDMAFMRKHPVIDILKHLDSAGSGTDQEIATGMGLPEEQVTTIMKRLYEIGATIYPLDGRARRNRLAPISRNLLEQEARA